MILYEIILKFEKPAWVPHYNGFEGADSFQKGIYFVQFLQAALCLIPHLKIDFP